MNEMTVIELIYKKPISEVEAYLESHRAFLQKFYEEGRFLMSGRSVPRSGGIIIGIGPKDVFEEIIMEDPFYDQGIADYRLMTFEASTKDARLNEII